MKQLITLLFLSFLCLAGPQPQQPSYDTIKTEAERLYAEASYSQARELYLKARAIKLPPEEADWVDFRLADTLWRAQAATQNADTTRFDTARQQLEALSSERRRSEIRDIIWAEAQESLGDFWWARGDARDWNRAFTHYQQALDWWAGTKDLELGTTRYLKIVWKMAHPHGGNHYYRYGDYGTYLPLEILDNALKISRSETDRAHAHYLIAKTLRNLGGDFRLQQRVPEEFEAALAIGKTSEWYDDALYHYALWMEQVGRYIQDDRGNTRTDQDYVKALGLFRRLITEYKKGETPYYDEATHQIENITKPAVNVSASSVFLPDSEVQFQLSWRNTKKVGLALYPVNLTRDFRLTAKPSGAGTWSQIDISGIKALKTWDKEINDKGDYRPGEEMIVLDRKLPVGAYLIEARIGGLIARDLLLVTDAALVVKASGKQAIAYFCNALSGAPLANAGVKLAEHYYNGKEYFWRESTKFTDREGMASFDLIDSSNNIQLIAVAESDNRQAFSNGSSYGNYREQQPWSIYAYTDRPAYRPNEVAHWKFTARKYQGSVYSTPAQQTIEFSIFDPRGTTVKEGKVELNAFGSAWGEMELTESMPLGQYQIDFYDVGRKRSIGNAALFRLEEYKLPEFQVSVQTPEENGRKKLYRLGDTVDVKIQADYYFGGSVADAKVEVLVYQNPFYHWWYPPREFPWYYEDISQRYGYYGGRQGQIVKRETIRTGATGKATISFDTPRGAAGESEYFIEARVTDSSRREITGSGTIRVTRQGYYLYPQAKHNIYRPQDKVAIDLKAIDADDQPVQAEGTIKVTRDHWYEIWLDPSGKEVKGEELKSHISNQRSQTYEGWRLKFRGYQHDEILTQTVKTDAEGEAEFSFTPEREGYYRIVWSSADKGGDPVKAETTVWVSTNATTELGYRHGGIEIIADRDTFRAGEKAQVMLHSPAPDRYVLFSVESDNLHSCQLVHLTGTIKLIEVPIEEQHTPNIYLSATMVSDRRIYQDSKQIVVPPAEHFLTVDVKADREIYEPREEGEFTVTTRDHQGRPVSTEVALGLADESVYYIQQDYAGDPRGFYYGARRQALVQTNSTFNQKSYLKLEKVGEKLEDRTSRLQESYDAAQEVYKVARTAHGRVFAAYDSAEYGATGNFFDRSAVLGDAERYDADSMPVNGRDVILRREIQLNGGVSSSNGYFHLMPGAVAESVVVLNQEPAVQVRSDFRSTVFWQPDVITDKDGKAVVKVKFPDSLTRWKATARASSEGNQFGIATAGVRTRQPLIVRLQAPRFFVTGDLATVSAVINNNTDQELKVSPSLDAQGLTITGLPNQTVTVAAKGEARVDWPVKVDQPGKAKLKVTARGEKYADAMERDFTVYEHGIEKLVARSGKLRGDDLAIRLDLPKERIPETTNLTVQITPSMAVTMLDSLPYLIDYPYGCTEQTMSRFLPAAITAKTLKDLGLNSEVVMSRMFGGIERTYSAQTHPEGSKDIHLLDETIRQSLTRLYDFQHSDGGWGWWKEGESDHFMTAYVVWGMTLARDAGIAINANVLERGVHFLDLEIVEEESDYDGQAWMLHALAAYHLSAKQQKIGEFQTKAFDNLWANRDKLNAYTRALLALSAQYFGNRERALTLVRNLENGVKIDTSPDTSIIQTAGSRRKPEVIGTAHWGEDGIYWRWSEGGVEATCFALRALLAIDPKNKLVEPVTNWLVKNRRGAQWSNTRDTAIAVLTLNDYLRASGELAADLEYDLLVNGQQIASKKITAADVLNAPSRFEIKREILTDGANEISIKRKSGNSPLYFSAQAQFFSREEPIKETGNEIFVRRQYYKLVARPTLLKGYVYERVLLGDGESVASGDRVEVVITIETKNNYEYLLFEDLKPSGLEAVQLRSGSPLSANELKSGAAERKFAPTPEIVVEGDFSPEERMNYTGRSRGVYQELRDRMVALFIDKLPEGIWEIRYQMRAETPGRFHALPVTGQAMYTPEIRSNGVETHLNISPANL